MLWWTSSRFMPRLVDVSVQVFHQLVDEIDQKAEHKMRQLFGEAQEMVEVREEHLHAFQGVTDRLSSIENLLCGEGEDGGHSVTTRVDQMHHRAQSHNTGILARLLCQI